MKDDFQHMQPLGRHLATLLLELVINLVAVIGVASLAVLLLKRTHNPVTSLVSTGAATLIITVPVEILLRGWYWV